MSVKNMLVEFKAFAFKGNMIDLAIAVVIGAAFSNVIQAMVKDIINPAISYAVTGVKDARDTATSMKYSVTSKIGPTGQPTIEPVAQTTTGQLPPGDKPKAINNKPAATDPTQAITLDWQIGRFLIGDFIGAIINFLIQALAVFLLIVKLSGTIVKKVGKTPAPSEPTTKECPYCLSAIPIKATKCSHCTADLPASGPAATMA